MRGIYIQEPYKMEVKEIDIPLRNPGETLIEVLACGICGTDLKIFKGQTLATYPLIPGHEVVGKVVESNELEKGMLVTIDPNKPCGRCDNCRRGKINLCENLSAVGVTRNGGFSEFLSVDDSLIYSLAPGTSIKTAVFAEPLSCIVNGFNVSNFGYVSDVAIIGGGPIGAIIATLAERFSIGKTVIAELNSERRKFLESELGLKAVDFLDPKKHLFDVVFDCTGNPKGFEVATSLTRMGGNTVIFGVTAKGAKSSVEPFEIYRKEVKITGSFINPFTMSTAVKILNSKEFNFDSLVTDELSLKEVAAYISGEKVPNMKAVWINH
ncbi:MAG: alcohol dehydrogenase catalytic domain-containing protein [Candidatus Hodarchaeales archaeon]